MCCAGFIFENALFFFPEPLANLKSSNYRAPKISFNINHLQNEFFAIFYITCTFARGSPVNPLPCSLLLKDTPGSRVRVVDLSPASCV